MASNSTGDWSSPDSTGHPEGTAWRTDIAAVAETCRQKWSLTLGPAYDRLSWNMVLHATRAEGTPAVLKIGPPGAPLTRETEALRLFDGNGSPLLYEADFHLGALLIERLEPGTALRAVEDESEAMRKAAGVMLTLWRPLPAEHPFTTVTTLAEGLERLRHRFNGGSGPIPERLVDRAQALFTDLIASQGDAVLLHGDLHHDNVLLSAERGWLAIDPKGIAGEREYEPGPLLRNPPSLLCEPQPARTLRHRIDQLSETLGLDRERVHGWALAQAVLAAAWGLEDSGQVWEQGLAFAELLAGSS